MPDLDRIVTVTYTTTTTNRNGEVAVVINALGEVWARKVQDSVARTLAGQGGYATAARSYRVRYNALLVTAIQDGETIKVMDGGHEQTIDALGEPERAGRRRFLDLIVRES